MSPQINLLKKVLLDKEVDEQNKKLLELLLAYHEDLLGSFRPV